jgi:DNA polymerase-3 subunit chi
MSEIRFYHMEQSTLDQALPAITSKALQSGKPILIKGPDKKEVKRLDDLLWSFHPQSFLPHGTDKGDQPPVFLTPDDDNANNSKILILTHGCTFDDVSQFDLVCEMLDGRVDTQIIDARKRWKVYKDDGHDLTYWQQDENGKWDKKA